MPLMLSPGRPICGPFKYRGTAQGPLGPGKSHAVGKSPSGPKQRHSSRRPYFSLLKGITDERNQDQSCHRCGGGSRCNC